jgi:putative transposase
MSAPDRRGMLDRSDKTLSIRRQCALTGVARSSRLQTCGDIP